MSPKRPQLAIEGRIRSEEEYITWAARVMRDAEDIRESITEDRWKEHVRNKYYFSMDDDAANRQMTGLWEKGVKTLFKDAPAVDVIPLDFIWKGQAVRRYQDATTRRWISFQEVSARLYR